MTNQPNKPEQNQVVRAQPRKRGRKPNAHYPPKVYVPTPSIPTLPPTTNITDLGARERKPVDRLTDYR
ncbi:hypothetical protein BpHYR1_012385 [Brachionus plicatilis]|uniref:Uncharacterized protein n=1 Tax=Brachionus plicatilis TaxID=10195 RepID=A0A3M7RUA3_BRAPC|nr:hypothetical protein BpHYR1_012385 [Brachionus plicatilis]